MSIRSEGELHATVILRRSHRRPRAPQPGPVGQVARWFETIVAFARWYPCGIETAIAFARWYLCGIETAIAFADENWAFLVHFSGAEVMPVSAVPCCGCAVVVLVSTSPCFCVLCAKYFALLGLMCARARKSSPSTRKMAQNGCFMARWASFFAEMRLKGAAWGEFFRGSAVVGSRRASVLRRAPGSRALLLAPLTLQCAAKPYWWHGGQPAQVTTSRVNVRMKGPRPPPIGLACELKGSRVQDAFIETEEGLTACRRPDAPHDSSDTTEAGPRRIPPLVACGGSTSALKRPSSNTIRPSS